MHNKKFSSIVAIFVAIIAVFSAAKFVQAATTSHIIINEIQTAGASSNDEFVEIFNPSDTSIVLDGYKLSKKTKTGSESTLLSSATLTKFLGTIPAHGYFLIAHPDYKGSLPADLAYSSSSSISSDNTILLYNKDGALLDKVGFGAASVFESSPASNPSASQSIERDNFSDTDNNAADFSINTSPSPQNSAIVETNNEIESSTDDTVQNNSEKCATSSQDVKLNEIFPYPETGDQEFVELKNFGKVCMDLSGWKIEDAEKHKYTFPPGTTVEPEKFLLASRNFYMNNTSAETMYLFDSSGKEVDKISYAKALFDSSFSFDGKEFLWSSTSTPGEENVFDAPENETAGNSDAISESVNTTASEKVYLSEILPNPKGDEETDEFIEIVNGDNEPVDLFGWTIRDESKSGKYFFKEHAEIKPGEYLAIYRPQFKIALNNSAESVSLYNPQGELTSRISYDKSLENASYSFDGKGWKWSKYSTPGKKNKFDSEPSVKVNKPKNTYKDLFTKFSAKAKDKETKNLKYAWDFGDGKKSYLAKTSHKYLDTGKYIVTLSVSDNSQTVEKSFSLNVKKYPRPDLKITKIVPNPAGNDSEGEAIDIQNNSSQKIDLAGWKIATGSGEKIYNHPISGNFSLNANETKTITREFSKFSLNNKTGKVQLVMPDGKVVDIVEYAKEKIADDEAYAKIDGEWKWIEPTSAQEENTENKDIDSSDEPSDAETAPVEDENAGGEVLGATDEIENASYDPSFTSEDAFIFLSAIGFFKSPNKEINYCPLKNTTASLEYFLISSI